MGGDSGGAAENPGAGGITWINWVIRREGWFTRPCLTNVIAAPPEYISTIERSRKTLSVTAVSVGFRQRIQSRSAFVPTFHVMEREENGDQLSKPCRQTSSREQWNQHQSIWPPAHMKLHNRQVISQKSLHFSTLPKHNQHL